MTQQTVAQLLIMMKTSYPGSFSTLTPEEVPVLNQMWFELFKDFPDHVVFSAFKEYLTTSGSTFAPNAGQLMQIIAKRGKSKVKVKEPEEAWAEVVKVMGSADMHYEPSKAFNNLPKLIRLAVGSVSTLRLWSRTEIDKLSYAKRDFIARYKELLGAEEKKLLESDNLVKLANGTYGQEETLEIAGKTVNEPDSGQHISSFLAELMEFESFSPQKLKNLEEVLSD